LQDGKKDAFILEAQLNNFLFKVVQVIILNELLLQINLMYKYDLCSLSPIIHVHILNLHYFQSQSSSLEVVEFSLFFAKYSFKNYFFHQEQLMMHSNLQINYFRL